MKLSRVRTRFFLSNITRPRWLEFPIARTYFDSTFEFEGAKFYCKYMFRSQVQNVVLQNFILNTVSDWFNDKELTNGSFRCKLREKRLPKGPK